MGRAVYLVAGWACVALGLIGVVLPVLPTTPFMILAAFLFAKGSPRARAWLVDHPRFGRHIRDWEDHGTISARAKKLAIGAMAAVFAVSLLLGLSWWLLLVQGSAMLVGAGFILSRPSSAP